MLNARILLTIAVVLWSVAVQGAERKDPWNALYDGWDGATCDFFNNGARLRWKTRGGDFLDSAGKPRGDRPFAENYVQATGQVQSIQWDVTSLVRGWVRGDFPNAGLVLALVPGKPRSDTAVFVSREVPAADVRPQLVVRLADGKETTLPAIADTELNCSTVTSLGANADIKVGGDRSGALQFDVTSLRVDDVARATLKITAAAHQYGNNTVGVYRVDAPVHPASGKAEQGLAAAYKGDRGIEKNPDVLLADGFESAGWRSNWTDISLTSTIDRIERDDALRFAPLAGHAVRVTIPKKYNQGMDMSYALRDRSGIEPEAIYMRYYLRFADDWDPGEDGGKLPGPSGTYGKAGWGGRKADPTQGWSMRGQFHRAMSPQNPFSGRVAIGTYAYHAGGDDLWGDHWDWMRDGLGLLERNRWYCIEQYFRVNTLGKRDGVMRAWIDGKLAFEKTDVRVRDVDTLRIEKIWMNVYYGGTAPAPRDLRVFIDNVVIAKRYIGPMGAP